MAVLYASTIIWGVLGTGMALLLVKLTDSALDVWWTLSGIFGGGMCGLFLLGVISRRAGNPAAITGVLAGVLVILWLSWPKVIDYLLAQPAGQGAHELGVRLQELSQGWLSPLHAFLVPVLGTLTILLVGLAVSRLSAFSDVSARTTR
jgi:SSS family solute:Na+ symporter